MLKGKNAIITGGVRGIGLGIAEEFCRNGANVMITYHGNYDAAKAAVEKLSPYGTKVIVSKGDVADEQYAAEAVAQAVEAFGGLDILVNNAGITNDKLMARMTLDDFMRVINTNLAGAFNFSKAAAGVMMKKRTGRIINLSSISGVAGNAGQANYSASKAGIIGLTKSNAKELGRRNITVTAIAPGFIETDMTAVLTDKQREEMVKQIVMGRTGTVEDVAKLAAFLASDAASYITGQVIGVDGGIIA
jgi:3-oxoacyl-[acyl-carrier protein] reductase